MSHDDMKFLSKYINCSDSTQKHRDKNINGYNFNT